MQCIFCHKESYTSKSVEHIIPESLGNNMHVLPKGYVCDECNNYFSIKIEKKLLAQPYFVSMRFRNEILTKKGKLVKERMIFPGALKSAEVVLQKTDNGFIASFNDEELYECIKEGRTKTMIEPYISEPEYPNTTMSRFLAKCAYEFFLYNMRENNYNLCVQELLSKGNNVLKTLREYARYGKGKYWQYSQRRIYSEGHCMFNPNEGKFYELLHEMMFFTKEYVRFPNGNIETEIYFVLAISGIEYAICISDPDISEYIKWLKVHNGHSPLEDDNEGSPSFSLSDVSSILIRKDDDRIH